jgi:hypothetical protein
MGTGGIALAGNAFARKRALVEKKQLVGSSGVWNQKMTGVTKFETHRHSRLYPEKSFQSLPAASHGDDEDHRRQEVMLSDLRPHPTLHYCVRDTHAR